MKIQVTKDQAQIQIQSPHAIVRDLLEGTAQRLREMMASQGIDLTNFDVGSQQQHADNGGSAGTDEKQSQGMTGSATESDQATGTESLELDQLVDYYV
jgi:flagellar hook-length control protein FliK